VEILDFAGPMEVFNRRAATARSRVYTVAATRAPVL
jgi:hypothetical protein